MYNPELEFQKCKQVLPLLRTCSAPEQDGGLDDTHARFYWMSHGVETKNVAKDLQKIRQKGI